MTSSKAFKQKEDYLNLLTESEKQILPFLKEAVKKTDKIFLLQEKDNNNGANLYPRDATRREIEQAASKDPKVLSPFTIVERNRQGKLEATDYHIKFAKEIQQITKLLKKAITICQNSNFKNYLNTLAESLVNGNYENAYRAWLNTNGTSLDLIIGPYERYLDKMFFVKRAYQAAIGIIDKEKTNKAKVIRDILYTTIGSRPDRVIPPSIVDIEVQYTLAYSGLLGKMFFAQQHLPADTQAVEKYGSKIVCFLPAIEYKFEKLIYPIFKAVFEKTFKSRYDKELLSIGNYYVVLLQGIAQHLHRYRGSRTRLRDIFPIFDEANSVVSGIQNAKNLVLKGVIDQKILESIMIAQICWTFSEWIISKTTNIRGDYLKGDAIALNFFMKEGAIQEHDGLSWPNFAKMFFEMENLSAIFTNFLENGTYSESQEFVSQYLSYEPFKGFEKRLAEIKPL